MARAVSTRCLTTAEDSGTVVLRSSSKWSDGTSVMMSMRSSSGPEMRER
jgi:hypothetical protein